MNEKQIAMGMHLSALAGFIIPFGNIIAPLILWLMNKEKSPYLDSQGKEALNFQITVTILFLPCLILMFIFIGILFAVALGIFNLAMIIIATIKISNGEDFKYPFSFRLIK